MSLLIKALKKAERDNEKNREAMQQADRDLAMLTETSANPAEVQGQQQSTTIQASPAVDAATVNTPATEPVAEPPALDRRPPLAFADQAEDFSPPVPAVDTPRHETPGHQPNPEPTREPPDSLQRQPDDNEMQLTSVADSSPSAAEFAAPTGMNSPGATINQAAPPEQPPLAKPMMIVQSGKAPKLLVWAAVILATLACFAWLSFEYMKVGTIPAGNDILTPIPVSPIQREPLTRNGPSETETSSANSKPALKERQTDASTASIEAGSTGAAAESGSESSRVAPSRATTRPKTSTTKAASANKPTTSIRIASSTAKNFDGTTPKLPPVRFVRKQDARNKKLNQLNSAYQQLRRGDLNAARA
ncbi:MAG: hypothetical protein WBD34_01645, partial [Burkholderiaceae bacterium]